MEKLPNQLHYPRHILELSQWNIWTIAWEDLARKIVIENTNALAEIFEPVEINKEIVYTFHWQGWGNGRRIDLQESFWDLWKSTADILIYELKRN